MYNAGHVALANRLLILCRDRKLRLAAAESCTGGLVAAVLTSIAGSSDVVDCAIVSYSNEAKTSLLDVPTDIIAEHGAVSETVARLMAEGVLKRRGVELSVAVTGIAGPGGGSAAKPVGLVHIASAGRHRPTLHQKLMLGDQGRETIRLTSVTAALELAIVQAATGP